MNMIRTTLTALALALASVSARASDVGNYECGIITRTPAPSKKEPLVYKINVDIIFNAIEGKWRLTGMAATHTFVNGDKVERSEQYVDRVFRDTNTESTWRGTYIKDPSTMMVGTFKRAGEENFFYTEKLYKQNRLVWTMVSQCHPVEVER
jgi:hypothetical protein